MHAHFMLPLLTPPLCCLDRSFSTLLPLSSLPRDGPSLCHVLTPLPACACISGLRRLGLHLRNFMNHRRITQASTHRPQYPQQRGTQEAPRCVVCVVHTHSAAVSRSSRLARTRQTAPRAEQRYKPGWDGGSGGAGVQQQEGKRWRPGGSSGPAGRANHPAQLAGRPASKARHVIPTPLTPRHPDPPHAAVAGCRPASSMEAVTAAVEAAWLALM